MERWLASLSALLLTVTLAHAKTIEVSPTGNDGVNCTGTMRTINAGLRCLAPGDTLLIRGGTYPEVLASSAGTQWPSGTSWSAPITIAGAPGERVVIRPTGTPPDHIINIADGGAYTDTSYREYLILDNLVIDASAHYPWSPVRLEIGARHIRLQNSILIGNANSNAISFGGDTSVSPTAIARESEILNNEIYGNGGYGLYVGSSGNLIDGNYIHDNQGYGIHTYSAYGGVHHNVIRNNRVVHNGWNNPNPAGSCGILLSSGDHNIAINNVVQDQNGCGVGVSSGAGWSEVLQNTILDNTGPCIEIAPGTHDTIVRDNACQRNVVDILDTGRTSQISHNWFEPGPIPEGYGARGIVTGPIGQRLPVRPPVRNLRVVPRT